MTQDNIEIGICDANGFRRLSPSQVNDYLANIQWFRFPASSIVESPVGTNGRYLVPSGPFRLAVLTAWIWQVPALFLERSSSMCILGVFRDK